MTNHNVFNQPPELAGYNLYKQDAALQEGLHRGGAKWAEPRIIEYGRKVGQELREAGFLANTQLPVLHTHDRFGHRIDRVDYHPAYHQLMATAIEHGLHSLPWREPQTGAHVARAALCYLHHQADAGSGCPLTMTFAAWPVLRQQSRLSGEWSAKLKTLAYDAADKPYFSKTGVTLGMAMTEKQGGSDLRSNCSQARPLDRPEAGELYRLSGHKWFCSAPMSDAFLVLAQAEGGLSCFLMPRWCPDGSRNALYIQRLKSKTGNRSNASGEIEFQDALGWMLGSEGRGIATIMEMVALTRFDCMVGSAALMRQAVAQALHHCAHRQVFGHPLNRQPLMQNVLADLAIESEAALALSQRVAEALDGSQTNPAEAALVRLATAVGKYWICKRVPGLTYEAMECLGGNGYVEKSMLPRLYREAPVNAIWEGSGNVQCLDVLRVLSRQPETLAAYLEEIREVASQEPRLARYLTELENILSSEAADPYRARHLMEHLAIALQASLLLRYAPSTVAEAFCASRLSGDSSPLFGGLPRGIDCQAITDRSWPGGG